MANPPAKELLTIGAFSRTSHLSIKALRLYDEIGLLSPVRIDPVTGYRYYSPGQLDRARWVAWLRRLGMPLARIQLVCEAAETDRAAAARAIGEYWRQVEADTAVRRELADFLIAQLSSTRETLMSDSIAALEIRYAAMSDRGLVRTTNQDCAYAGPRLLAVAHGFGDLGAEAGQVPSVHGRPFEDGRGLAPACHAGRRRRPQQCRARPDRAVA